MTKETFLEKLAEHKASKAKGGSNILLAINIPLENRIPVGNYKFKVVDGEDIFTTTTIESKDGNSKYEGALVVKLRGVIQDLETGNTVVDATNEGVTSVNPTFNASEQLKGGATVFLQVTAETRDGYTNHRGSFGFAPFGTIPEEQREVVEAGSADKA